MTAPPVAGAGVRRSWIDAAGLAGRSRGVRALTAIVVVAAILAALIGALLPVARPADRPLSVMAGVGLAALLVAAAQLARLRFRLGRGLVSVSWAEAAFIIGFVVAPPGWLPAATLVGAVVAWVLLSWLDEHRNVAEVAHLAASLSLGAAGATVVAGLIAGERAGAQRPDGRRAHRRRAHRAADHLRPGRAHPDPASRCGVRADLHPRPVREDPDVRGQRDRRAGRRVCADPRAAVAARVRPRAVAAPAHLPLPSAGRGRTPDVGGVRGRHRGPARGHRGGRGRGRAAAARSTCSARGGSRSRCGPRPASGGTPRTGPARTTRSPACADRPSPGPWRSPARSSAN